jgi:hypothetical protein
MKKFALIITIVMSFNISMACDDCVFRFITIHNDTITICKSDIDSLGFSLIDTLQLWCYSIDTNYRGSEFDPIKPIGQILFWRIKPIDDSISKGVYNKLWTPYITFDIYTIADTNYCFNLSSKTKFFSSCIDPNVGGDVIIVDKFVFLNHSVCLRCCRYDTGIDYCRPIVNYIFSQIDKTKVTTIQSLVEQFVISESAWMSDEYNGYKTVHPLRKRKKW